ncbi:TolC family protein [bacterium]|nr:TolC family protein [bacterium]
MLRPTAALLALALAFSATPARALAPIGLDEAVKQALAQNPQLMAAERQVEAAQAREVQAAALPNPNLKLSADSIRLGSSGGDYKAGLSQPLLLGGQRAARTEVAKLDKALAEFERAVLRQDLEARVKEAYARVLFEQEGLAFAKGNADAAQAHLRASQILVKAGEVPQVEALRAELDLSRAQRAVASSEGRVADALGRLNVLLGRKAEEPLAIQALPIPKLTSLPPVAQLVATSLERRPELSQAEANVQRETLLRRVALSGMWTGAEIEVGGGLSDGSPAIGASLTLPMPFYRQQGEVAEAEANRARAEAQRDQLRNEISLEVARAHREATLAADQAGRYQQAYLPQAERLLDNAQRRFRAGEGSGLEVIEARRALFETQTGYQQALLDFRLAIASLERATGSELTR